MSGFRFYPDGRPAEQWDDAARIYRSWNLAGQLVVERPYLAGENTQADADAASALALTNDGDLRAKANAALDANAAFLALAPPTNAQTVAQVQRLTRECSALIRLMLRALTTVDGT